MVSQPFSNGLVVWEISGVEARFVPVYSMASIPNLMNRSPFSLEMMQELDELRLRGFGSENYEITKAVPKAFGVSYSLSVLS